MNFHQCLRELPRFPQATDYPEMDKTPSKFGLSRSSKSERHAYYVKRIARLTSCTLPGTSFNGTSKEENAYRAGNLI